MLEISSELAERISRHGVQSYPHECCGALLGTDGDTGRQVRDLLPLVNRRADSPRNRFSISPGDFRTAEAAARERGLELIGWYHSHPGFGVFLSDHDTFIHRNFFSSKRQVAWVYDPHSDEEGCFGWQGDRIVRLTQVDIVDRRGGEAAESSGQPKPAVTEDEIDDVSDRPRIKLLKVAERDDDSLERMVSAVFSHLSVLLLGFAISYFLLPREKVLLMALPIDPRTMTPLGPPVPVPPEQAREILKAMSPADDGAKSPQPSGSAGSPGKEGNGDHR